MHKTWMEKGLAELERTYLFVLLQIITFIQITYKLFATRKKTIDRLCSEKFRTKTNMHPIFFVLINISFISLFEVDYFLIKIYEYIGEGKHLDLEIFRKTFEILIGMAVVFIVIYFTANYLKLNRSEESIFKLVAYNSIYFLPISLYFFLVRLFLFTIIIFTSPMDSTQIIIDSEKIWMSLVHDENLNKVIYLEILPIGLSLLMLYYWSNNIKIFLESQVSTKLIVTVALFFMFFSYILGAGESVSKVHGRFLFQEIENELNSENIDYKKIFFISEKLRSNSQIRPEFKFLCSYIALLSYMEMALPPVDEEAKNIHISILQNKDLRDQMVLVGSEKEFLNLKKRLEEAEALTVLKDSDHLVYKLFIILQQTEQERQNMKVNPQNQMRKERYVLSNIKFFPGDILILQLYQEIMESILLKDYLKNY